MTTKTRSYISLVLLILLTISMIISCYSDSLLIEGTPPVRTKVSVSPQNLIGPPGWIDINETFTITLTVSDVIDLYYWQAGMTFNPDVLYCISFVEGPFLMAGGDTVWQPATIDNEAGIISPHGAALTGVEEGVSGNGTLGMIAFKVKDSGISELHLTDVVLLDSNLEKIGVIVIDGHFDLPPPQPGLPNASFTYSPLVPYENETVTFDASESSPNGGKIVSYDWDFGDSFFDNGMIVNHTYTTAGEYNVTLTVTDNKELTDSAWQLVVVSERPVGALIDVYTQRDGRGPMEPSDAFAPQEMVIITAYLTYNGSPLSGKLVSFEVYDPNDTIIRSRTATTDDDGLATVGFRILTDSSFGTYTAVASALVEEETVSDAVWFEVGWLVEIVGVIPCDLFGNPKTSFIKRTMMCFNVTVKNVCLVSKSVKMRIFVLDELDNLIGFFVLSQWQIPLGQTEFIVGLMVPEWGISGNAIVYANAFTDWPSLGGYPYCPEVSATFIITRA